METISGLLCKIKRLSVSAVGLASPLALFFLIFLFLSMVGHDTARADSFKWLDTGVHSDFCDVYFTSANNGAIVGSEELILYTKDGGRTWAVREIDNVEEIEVNQNTNNMSSTASSNDRTGSFKPKIRAVSGDWFVGEYGLVGRRTNKGFKIFKSKYTCNFNGVTVNDDGQVMIVGDNGVFLILVKDESGSLYEFFECDSGTTANLTAVSGLYGIEGNTDVYAMIAADDGTLVKYSFSSNSSESIRIGDHGMNDVLAWASHSLAAGDEGSVALVDNETNEVTDLSSGTTEDLNSICRYSQQTSEGIVDTYWFAGDNGTILSYKEGAWTDHTGSVPTTNDLNSIFYLSDGSIVAVGSPGTIVRYDGQNWEEVASGTTDMVRGLWGDGSGSVWAVGANGAILKKENGGMWKNKSDSSLTTNSLYGVSGSGADDVWGVGANGAIIHNNEGGWNDQTNAALTNEDLASVSFNSNGNGLAVGANGAIISYENNTWVNNTDWSLTSDKLYGCFQGDGYSYAVGVGGVVLSNKGAGWAVDNGVDTTRWLHSVWASSGNDVWTGGQQGTLYHNNGSSWTNWTDEDVSTSALYGIWGADSNNVFFVGESGTILKYNGSEVQKMETGSSDAFFGVWGTTADDVYAAGFRVFHYMLYDDDGFNSAPTADDKTVETTRNQGVAIELTGKDEDGDDFNYAIVDSPANGIVTGDPPEVTYTPNQNFVGADSFTYKTNDGLADSDAATVSITVRDDQNNNPPTANDQALETDPQTSLSIELTADDADGDPLTYTIVTQPSNGTLSGAPPSLEYTPDNEFVGADSFTFKANDGLADSNIGTINITVGGGVTWRRLTVTLEGSGTGVVTSDPAGVDCGEDCGNYYEDGAVVNLTAVAGSGMAFDGWQGGGCSGNGECQVAMNADHEITATFNPDSDSDGASDAVEDAGPNSGDGDYDGTADSQQAGTATFMDGSGKYVTLTTDPGTLSGVYSTGSSPEDPPDDYTFPAGFFGFTITGLNQGETALATLFIHGEDQSFDTYYRYGSTPDDQADHWYEFLKGTGDLGAEISQEELYAKIILYLQDGHKGDDDLTENGIINDIGGPGTTKSVTVVTSDGDDDGEKAGCFLGSL